MKTARELTEIGQYPVQLDLQQQVVKVMEMLRKGNVLLGTQRDTGDSVEFVLASRDSGTASIAVVHCDGSVSVPSHVCAGAWHVAQFPHRYREEK